MAQWRDFLGRFRPAGAPGAAAPRGVPADRLADAAAELAPLLTLIDDVDAEIEQIRGRATLEAAELRFDGERRAAAIVERARYRAESVAQAAAAQVRSRAVAEQAELDAEHVAELDRLRARTTLRMPDYVQRIVAEARAIMTQVSRS